MSKGLVEMKVGELAEATGVSVQTIRFYERRGLLPTPRRLQSGYRDYPAETVRTVLRLKPIHTICPSGGRSSRPSFVTLIRRSSGCARFGRSWAVDCSLANVVMRL